MPGTTTDDDPIAAANSAHPDPTNPPPASPRSRSSADRSSAASSTNTASRIEAQAKPSGRVMAPHRTFRRETRGLLHANLFRCGWRARHSLAEIYRLPRVGFDQADRLRWAGGGSVACQLVRIDLRLDRAGPLPLIQDEAARCDGYAHGRPDAHVLVDGDLPARHGSPHRIGSSRRLWIAIPGLNSSSLAGTASRSPGSRPIKPRKAS